MYKLRYGKTFNIGNYESERVEIEEIFDDKLPKQTAMEYLRDKVEKLKPPVKQGYYSK